jgi:hypothetical protein
VGVDTQTMHVTYDGKYGLQIFSGFQRMEACGFVLRQDTLEPVGFMPNFGRPSNQTLNSAIAALVQTAEEGGGAGKK